MAMITGRVQIEEKTKPREIEVGNAFARKDKGQWKTLDGKNINRVEVRNLQSKIQEKVKAKAS